MRVVCLAVMTLLTSAIWSGVPRAAHVPNDYPTIQAAIDAGERQVVVADGDYDEHLVVAHDLELLPEETAWNPVFRFQAYPRVLGLKVQFSPGSERIRVRGFHFSGAVSVDSYNWTDNYFEARRMDSGFSATGGLGQRIGLRGCIIRGGADIYAYHQDVTACTFIGGGVTVRANGSAVVRDNLVMGPAPIGIEVTSDDATAFVTGNTVKGTVNGIVVHALGVLRDNLVEDCAGDAFVLADGMAGSTFEKNVVRRCAGNGFNLFGRAVDVTGNTVERVGGAGVLVSVEEGAVHGNVIHGTGLDGIQVQYGGPFVVDDLPVAVIGNTVLHAGGDGIASAGAVRWNVVGRSAGRGIVARSGASNTSYANGDAGFVFEGSNAPYATPDTVTHNVAYGNHGAGLVWSGTNPPTIGCNDWYANTGGATVGVTPGATDLAVDPLFCHVAADDVTLRSDSPLIAAPGCGPVGALGVGCSATVGMPVSSAASGGAFYARPLPARGAADFAWTPEPGEVRVEVYDLQGAKRWSGGADGMGGGLRWDGRDAAGAALPPGVYFTRKTARSGVVEWRVVIVK